MVCLVQFSLRRTCRSRCSVASIYFGKALNRNSLFRLANPSRKTWLDPNPANTVVVQNAIGYDETWYLFVNVRPDELQGSAGHGRRKAARKDSPECSVSLKCSVIPLNAAFAK